MLYLKVILNCLSVICPSPTRQSSRNSSMREGAMTLAVPEGDLDLFVCHLSLAHQTVVQKLLHEGGGNDPLRLYLKVILNSLSVICPSSTRQPSRNSSMREGSMTLCVCT